jgi:nucleoid DNA-binding protein
MITGKMITKDEQIRVVARAAGINAHQARIAIETVVGLVIAGLVKDDRFMLHGLGTFLVAHRRARRVMNPSNGVLMDLPPSAVVKFKPTLDLRKRVEDKHL